MSEEEPAPARGRTREYFFRGAAIFIAVIGGVFAAMGMVDDAQETRIVGVVVLVVLLAYGIGGPRLMSRLGLGQFNE